MLSTLDDINHKLAVFRVIIIIEHPIGFGNRQFGIFRRGIEIAQGNRRLIDTTLIKTVAGVESTLPSLTI